MAHAKAWMLDDLTNLDPASEVVLRDACEFHFRLQSIEGFPDYLRSVTRFRTAIGCIAMAKKTGAPSDIRDVVGYYLGQADEEWHDKLESIFLSIEREPARDPQTKP
jgi:hypothetical protein